MLYDKICCLDKELLKDIEIVEIYKSCLITYRILNSI